MFMAGTENRLKKIENIRVLAIILVVLGHSIILYSPGWDLFETTRQAPLLSRLKRMIDLIQMPLFFRFQGICLCLLIKKSGESGN